MFRLLQGFLCLVLVTGSLAEAQDAARPSCARTVRADVVAIDQAYQINRLGTARPGGLLYALRNDVESIDGAADLKAGRVQLKAYKRPRPIVLRANEGDCLTITFQNLLAASQTDPIQPVTRNAGIHITGMQLRDSMASDGTWVGQNPAAANGMSGLVAPGESITYQLYASAEGAYLLYSTAGDYNAFGTMQLTMGLFGALNVEPRQSEWYRSQVSEEDLRLATTGAFADGHPKLDYDAVYPAGHPRAGKPILRMLDRTGNLVHSDLTAVITGKDQGLLPGGPGNNPVLPNRNWPFREVTVHYHESQDVVQPFAYFYDGTASHVPTVNAGSDSFAINYGLAGIGPEILANRIRVGPTSDCEECKFEEFFLSSWPQGDPGLVVDIPANAEETTPCLLDAQFRGTPSTGPQSRPCTAAKKRPTKAFYPDDPSNVYHSYLGDHVRFRILHAGAAVTHVHHHHAHQWLHSPTDQNSNYLDSQSIGPGSSFTLELVYNGSGNRNLTAGDSIFHCHFYPHFASGMWALFRVHDAFEAGTPLDDAMRPKAGVRALPDPQIATGTPIPAIVPLPTMAMAPLPSPVEIIDGQVKLGDSGFPGYPFYIPGISGHRAPHPPLDFAKDARSRETYDGGLPRHLITDAVVANEQHSLTDWSKDLAEIRAFQLPEDGTPSEKRAFAFFGTHLHPSFNQHGQAMPFKVNGLPRGPQSGAPFADPDVEDGKPTGNEQPAYKGATIQVDAVFNKAGWHYPQQRMMSLWGDVKSFVDSSKPPEPLFFRAHANDVISYWHTNLVPAYYELDDFQVRTPTDIIGQHIHLVKFDVMASDGASNGFNYEDGTYSPEEVQDRIAAINATGGLWNYDRTAQTKLSAKAIPQLGNGPGNTWVGAQATVQRWWVDPLMDTRGNDRTYMTVFTHDHFGPSTHQMIGLYGALLVEPDKTNWTSLDGKTKFRDWGVRDDGGPTSYAANIIYTDPQKARDSYREFALEWGDLQLVYGPNSKSMPDCYSYVYKGQMISQTYNCNPVATSAGSSYTGWADPNVINCPQCSIPSGTNNTPTFTVPSPAAPFLIADFGAGMMSMNYRIEPLPLRIFNNPVNRNPNASPNATDLSYAFASIPRTDMQFSTQPTGGSLINPACTGPSCFRFPVAPISNGMGAADPYTPLLAGYEGDKVQFRVIAGAHTSMHDFTVHGARWKYQPFSEDSGYRNTQFTILSEHFEMLFDLPRIGTQTSADYLYNPSASYEGLTNGVWGLLRSWNPAQPQPFLAPLSSNPTPVTAQPVRPPATLTTDCAKPGPCIRNYEIRAVALPKQLNYNARGVNLGGNTYDAAHPIADPYALAYVRADQPVDVDNIQPLVLRVRAGDWIHITLHNGFTGSEPVFATSESANRSNQIPYANPYYYVNLSPSKNVGLHPQLVEMDITSSSGENIGNNPTQTATPGTTVEYWWYAGKIENGEAQPVEYGAVNLMPSDPLMHVYHGLFGALVVEPQGSHWVEDPNAPTAATIFANDKVYREFVLMVQDDIYTQLNGSTLYGAAFPLSAFNYRSEPPFLRYGKTVSSALGVDAPQNWTSLTLTDLTNVANLLTTTFDTTRTTSNTLISNRDPLTPILRAPAGMPVRLHLLSPGGIGDNQQVFELTGHVWQEIPFRDGSRKIGFNPNSYWTSTTSGFGPTTAYTILLEDSPDGSGTPAGGKFRIPGDYLYRSWTANQFQAGAWGLFRVAPNTSATFPDTVGITAVAPNAVRGFATVSPVTGKYASSVTLVLGKRTVKVPVRDGQWSYGGATPATFTVRSPNGGIAVWGAEPSVRTTEAIPTVVRRDAVRKDTRPRQPK